MRTTSRVPWARLAGVVILFTVLRRTGTDAVTVGVRSLDPLTLLLGTGIAVLTTVACAWRWHLVARALGVGIGLPSAVASCYRAQFLNTVLPGGVLGDVHRGVLHGRSVGRTGLALRAVAWERFAGQAVQVVLALVVLVLLPSPVRTVLSVVVWPVAAILLVVVPAAVLVAGRPGRPATSRAARTWRAVADDVRLGLLVRGSWPGVVLASAAAVAGHALTYVLAARAVGVTAPLTTLLPLVLLVLVAAGLPLNVAGWGPREGMAAWVFAAVGLGAGLGVSTAVAYGAMVLVANLPGAVVLLAGSGRSGGRGELPASPPRAEPAMEGRTRA